LPVPPLKMPECSVMSGTGSRMGTPFGESADFRAFTLCIKLSMSLVCQLIPA
jgi:hypothetical protein